MIAYIPRLIGRLSVGCRTRHAARHHLIAKALMPLGLIVASSVSLTTPVSAVTLSGDLYRALYLDPQISQSAARSCQAVYDLGIERAEKRVQLSGRLTGERDLAHNFNNNSDRGETPARLRGFNEGENDLFDAEIEGRYRLYDWGVSDNRISAERTRLAASRLSIEIELAERARELLEVLIAYEHTQTEISLLGQALDELVPHLEAMEAQSTAGSLSVSDYRSAKLAELDLDIRYQRAERQLIQIEREIEEQFGIAVDVAKPLLTLFLDNRPAEAASITAEEWSAVRLQDLSVQATRHDLHAIENELFPTIDGVVTSTVFDLTDFESEYQVSGRIEFRLPLYDGGANKAQRARTDWRIRELQATRDERLREFETQASRIAVDISRRAEEQANVQARLNDIETRFNSLMALLGNSLVSRLDITQLITHRATTKIEMSQTIWQQESAFLQAQWLSDRLLQILTIQIGENAC